MMKYAIVLPEAKFGGMVYLRRNLKGFNPLPAVRPEDAISGDDIPLSSLVSIRSRLLGREIPRRYRLSFLDTFQLL